MTDSYRIDVDCAACALKMENAARKVDGVEDCSMNFMLQKMDVAFADNADKQDVMKTVRKMCKRVERDCEVYL